MMTEANEREWISAHRGLQAPLPTGFESLPLALVRLELYSARKKSLRLKTTGASARRLMMRTKNDELRTFRPAPEGTGIGPSEVGAVELCVYCRLEVVLPARL